MAQEVNVINNTKHNIGIRYMVEGGFWSEQNLVPGASFPLSRHNIARLNNETSLFKDGELILEKESEEAPVVAKALGIDMNAKEIKIDDAEIKKMLKATTATMKKWIENIKNEWQLEQIYNIAITMDLPISKMRILDETLPSKAAMEESRRLEELAKEKENN